MNVNLFGIEAEIIPSGMCALLIPYADSEKDLTLQQSLDKLPKHQLAIFAAIQAIEWATYEDEPRDDAARTPQERVKEIHDRFHRATQERLWREIFVETRNRRRRCRKPTS